MPLRPTDPDWLKQAYAKNLVIGTSHPVADQLRAIYANDPAPFLASANHAIGHSAAATVAEWCEEYGWPAPVNEYRFAPPRRWKFDVAWPDLRVAIEFQGGIHSRGRHVRAKGFAGDCEKLSTAASLGWRVMPVTYAQMRKGKVREWVGKIMGEISNAR